MGLAQWRRWGRAGPKDGIEEIALLMAGPGRSARSLTEDIEHEVGNFEFKEEAAKAIQWAVAGAYQL